MPVETELKTYKGKRLGLLPKSLKPSLRLSRWLKAVPEHPTTADYLSRVNDWGMYGNNQFGTCGPTSVANSLKSISVYAEQDELSVSLNDVYDLYRRSGNPNFNPKTGAGDRGVVMQTMLDATLKGGIGGHKPLAFAQVSTDNIDELRAAISIFGMVLLGVTLRTPQRNQNPWDASGGGMWGGHAIPAGYYSSKTGSAADLKIVSWTQVIGMTDAFISRQLDEAWVVIWQQHIDHPNFQQNVDLNQMAKDFESLTGRKFPVTPPPQPPTPPEPPSPAPDWKTQVLVNSAVNARQDVQIQMLWEKMFPGKSAPSLDQVQRMIG